MWIPANPDRLRRRKAEREPLESTVSEVIDSDEIDNLPLEGRDVYTMLVTQPGVTSDAATGRGLGLAVNGQRPSSSNYSAGRPGEQQLPDYRAAGHGGAGSDTGISHLDQQFLGRVRRTSGFVANAITRTGGEQFHGVAIFT